MSFGLDAYMIPCPTKSIFGFPCPGCGGQRSVVHVLNGEFSDAFLMYPALYPLIFLAIFLALDYFTSIKRFSQMISIMSLCSVGFILINYGIELNKIFEFF